MAGLTAELSVMLPAKLKVLVREMKIEAPEAPLLKLMGLLTEIAKSPMCTMAGAEWDTVPGEPAAVIVTRYVPAIVELSVQDADAVAFPAKLARMVKQATVRPTVGLTTELSATVPAKLFTLVSETDIAAPVAPELKLAGVLTEMVKSPT